MLSKWHADEYYRRLLHDWDVQEFISRARMVNPRIQPRSIAFLTATVDELRWGVDPVINEVLHQMVRDREKRAKGANSRFVNDRRLRAWTQPEGINPQTFRWTQVRNMIVDLKEGLARA